MTDKELNINVLRELTNIANEIFANEINIAPGTYTAAELSKGKDAKGNVIGINYIQTLDENLITRSVCIENFKCTFERSNIFYLIWKFEQILKVVQKNKVRFTKVEHVHSDLSFCVNITNEIKTLVKCVGDDPSNPAFMNIYVDYKKGYMVASDAVRMKACKIEISDLEGESETNIFICPKDLKRISGACRISVSGKNVTITDSSGSVYLFYCSGLNYPKWESVVPYVSKSSCIKIANVKEVASFVKKRKGIMRISGKLGRTVVISLMEEYYDGSLDVYSEMTVNTETDISYDFSIMFKLENILPIIQSWNGLIFLNANYRPAAFGSIYNNIYFTMPYVTRNGTFEKEDFEIDRYNMVSLFSVMEDEEDEENEENLKIDSVQEISVINNVLSESDQCAQCSQPISTTQDVAVQTSLNNDSNCTIPIDVGIQIQASVLLWCVLISMPGMTKGAIMRKLTHTATQIRGPTGDRLIFYNSINTLKESS